MIKAPIPHEDLDRLEELYSYEILDTEQEREFDDLAQIAKSLTGMPTVLISLVDRERQWFKSRVGFDAATQLPRESSFCGHAICSPGVLLVNDALKDERFVDNPLVTGFPKVRFYAGFVLSTSRGFNLGTLCVIDYKANQLSETQVHDLSAIARQIVALLEARKKNRQLIALNRILSEKQAEIVETKKQAALAVLAGGLAHEINNPLAVVVSRVSILSRKLKRSYPEAKSIVDPELQSIKKASARISGIINDMLDFDEAYRNEVQRTVAMSDLIRRVQNLISERFAEHGISLSFPEFDDFVLEIKRNQVVKALYQLLVNAHDAVVGTPGAWVRLEIHQREGVVEFEVIDSGEGIRSPIRDRMMEPFFTTKEPGKGTGLGLAVASQYASSNGGSLSYNPDADHTSFSLTLPLASVQSPQQAS